jgi:hypothetical protein
MDDMIDMLMFTIETTSSHVMIELGVVNLDRVSLNNNEGCRIQWEFISNNFIKLELIILYIV